MKDIAAENDAHWEAILRLDQARPGQISRPMFTSRQGRSNQTGTPNEKGPH